MTGDTISIRGMRVACRIGVPEEERRVPQTLEVDLELWPATSLSGLKDRIDQTIDYYQVWLKVREIASGKERRLIETLAEDVLTGVLADPAIAQVRVEIRKFILPDTASVSIGMSRTREEIS